MARPDVETLLRHIHHLAGPCAPAELSDRDLLALFTARREEAAFVALVQRHGPLVLNVCRRLLRQEQDAEDVFQATFLVLARKAGSVRWHGSAAPWLHAVAHRLALKARAEALRRRRKEHEAARERPTTTAEDMSWREAVAILEEELGRLPERYRAPLLLCCWEGKTRDEAARLLGRTAGAVKGRLERGRELLRARLARRGVALSAGLLAVGLTRGGVPAALAGATVRLALATVGGAAGSIPPAVAALVGEALTAAKVRAAGVLLAAVLVAAGAGAWAHQAWAPRPPEQARADEEPAPAGDDRPPVAPPAAVAKAPEEKPPAEKPSAEEPPAPLPWPRADRDGDALPAGVARRLGTTRLRQASAVRLVAFSPDGKMLATAGGPEVHLWDTTTGKELHRIETAAMALAFSHGGETLAVAGETLRKSGIVRLNTKTGESATEKSRYVPGKSSLLSFSPDGQGLWALDVAGGSIWDTSRGQKPVAKTGDLRGAFALAFNTGLNSPAAIIATPAGLHCLDADGNEVGLLAKKGGADYTSLTAGNDLVAAGTVAGDVHLWEAGGRPLKPLHTMSEPGGAVLALTLSTNRGALRLKGIGAGAKGMKVYTWDTEKGKGLTGIELDGAPDIRPGRDRPKVVLSPDGTRVAVVGEVDQRVRLWDAATGKELFESAGHERGVVRAAFLADGKAVVSAGADGILRWPTDPDERPTRFAGFHGQGDVAAVSRDDKWVAAATHSGDITVWDAASGKVVREVHKAETILALDFAPDGKSLAVGAAGVQLLSLSDGSWRRIVDEREWTAAVAFSPDGKLLAADDRKGEGDSIGLWDVAAAKKVRTLDAPPRAWIDSLAFDPEGRVLAVAGQRSDVVTLYDVATGRDLRRLRRDGAAIHSLAFARGGRLLVAACADGLTLWEVATGAEVLHLTGHDGAVKSVAASADGNRLITGGADTTVLLWDLAAAWKETAPERPKGKAPPPAEELWRDLGRDGAAAYRAIYALAADRGKALLLGKKDLTPGAGVRDEVGALVADLDSADPKMRERALQGLRRIGSAAEPALRLALAGAKSEKLQARLRGLLADLEAGGAIFPDGDALYAARAVDLLELIGTAEARKRLEALARDGRTWALRREAKAALGRRPAP
jgi:RNA polymerase sigma factor (sigma-70 family)